MNNSKFGRPREFEDLRSVSVLIEHRVITEAQNMGLNISEICRNAVSAAVKNPEVKRIVDLRAKFKQIPKERMNRIRRLLGSAADPNSAAEVWVKWIKENIGIDVTVKELLDYVAC